MSSPKQIIQIAKDVAGSALVLISSGLVWYYSHDIILAGIFLALIVDLIVSVWILVEKKYTLADIKDFCGLICLVPLLTFTLCVGDATKYRLAYCIIFGVLGLIDCFCIMIHFTNILSLYTIFLLPDVIIETVDEVESIVSN